MAVEDNFNLLGLQLNTELEDFANTNTNVEDNVVVADNEVDERARGAGVAVAWAQIRREPCVPGPSRPIGRGL